MGKYRRLTVAVLLAAAIVWSSPSAEAHAVLLDATPKPGTAVAGPDVEVRLHYNARIDHQRSSLTLFDPDGHESPVAAGDAPVDAMTAKLKGLSPGKYRLRWQVLAVDGHITRGDVEFEVRAP